MQTVPATDMKIILKNQKMSRYSFKLVGVPLSLGFPTRRCVLVLYLPEISALNGCNAHTKNKNTVNLCTHILFQPVAV